MTRYANGKCAERITSAAILIGAAAFSAVYFELFLEQVYPSGLSLREALLSDWISWPVARMALLMAVLFARLRFINLLKLRGRPALLT